MLSLPPKVQNSNELMRGSRKFCQRGSKFDKFFLLLLFLVDEGIEDPNITINGPSSARQRHLNGVSLAGRRWPNIERWLGSFAIFQGIRTSIAKKAYICDFSGGFGPLAPPPLDPPLELTNVCVCSLLSSQYLGKVRINDAFNMLEWCTLFYANR